MTYSATSRKTINESVPDVPDAKRTPQNIREMHIDVDSPKGDSIQAHITKSNLNVISTAHQERVPTYIVDASKNYKNTP